MCSAMEGRVFDWGLQRKCWRRIVVVVVVEGERVVDGIGGDGKWW